MTPIRDSSGACWEDSSGRTAELGGAAQELLWGTAQDGRQIAKPPSHWPTAAQTCAAGHLGRALRR
eukprot:1822091-Prymnesium_polylepis.1